MRKNNALLSAATVLLEGYLNDLALRAEDRLFEEFPSLVEDSVRLEKVGMVDYWQFEEVGDEGEPVARFVQVTPTEDLFLFALSRSMEGIEQLLVLEESL